MLDAIRKKWKKKNKMLKIKHFHLGCCNQKMMKLANNVNVVKKKFKHYKKKIAMKKCKLQQRWKYCNKRGKLVKESQKKMMEKCGH